MICDYADDVDGDEEAAATTTGECGDSGDLGAVFPELCHGGLSFLR